MKEAFKYGSVVRKGIVLAEFSINSEISNLAKKIISNLDYNSPSSAIEQGSNLCMGFTGSDSITYVAICDKSLETKRIKIFLDKIKAEWSKRYGAISNEIEVNGKTEEFGPFIQQIIQETNEVEASRETDKSRLSQISQDTQEIETQQQSEISAQINLQDQMNFSDNNQDSEMPVENPFPSQGISETLISNSDNANLHISCCGRLHFCIRQYGLLFLIATIVTVIIVLAYLFF